MNLYFVKTFLEVIEAGNLNHAATRLHITQSTVTTRLNALEELLGQKLLIRSRSGVELTSAGFKFQRYAELLLQIWHQANYELKLPTGFEDVCNLGCHIDLWNEVGAYFINQMRINYPKTAISTWAGSSKELSQWLDTGKIDVAIGFGESIYGNYNTTHIFDDQLTLVSSDPKQVGVGLKDYIYVDMGPEVRRQHAEVFPESMNSGSMVSTPNWALDYILHWKGSGYLPLRMIQKHLDNNILFKVEDAPIFHRECYVIANPSAIKEWDWFKPMLSSLKTHLKNE